MGLVFRPIRYGTWTPCKPPSIILAARADYGTNVTSTVSRYSARLTTVHGFRKPQISPVLNILYVSLTPPTCDFSSCCIIAVSLCLFSRNLSSKRMAFCYLCGSRSLLVRLGSPRSNLKGKSGMPKYDYFSSTSIYVVTKIHNFAIKVTIFRKVAKYRDIICMRCT